MSGEAPEKNGEPLKKAPPAFQNEIKQFEIAKLKESETEIHDKLPTEQDIAVEKTAEIREELRHFSTDKLKHAETVEKKHVEVIEGCDN